jgi:nicotinamide-nucleotide amidase
MRAIVLSIGEELLRGDIVDTNSAFLARELAQRAFLVRRLVTAGDSLDSLTESVSLALHDAELVVATGGLGPTEDDQTRNAIAAALGEELYVDEALVAQIEERFASMRRRMPARNRRQAELIPSARAIPNPNGTAPGWLVRRDDRMVIAMPGPPGEMRPMWRDSVAAEVERLVPGHSALGSVMTFGLGESAVEERIESVIHWHPDVTVATYAKPNGVQVHITARGDDGATSERLLSEAEGQVRALLGKAVFASGDATLAEVVGALLRKRGLTLAIMESATGGALSSLITDVDGSSEYFLGGVVAYTREVKALHGVDADTMDRYGLISEQTGLAMAAAARRELGSDVGVGVTGIAGREPVEGKPAGTCYIAVTMDAATEVREIRRPGPRDAIKPFFAQSALDLVRRVLLEHDSR